MDIGRHYIVFLVLIALIIVSSGCTANGIYHTVQPGQTLYRIAKTYDIEEARLAAINGIHDPRKLRAGQRVFIPNVTHVRSVPVTAASRNATVKTSSPARPTATKPALRPQSSKSVAAPKKAKPTVKTKTRTTASHKPAKGLFDWPVQGKVLSRFGTKSAKTNKGIEIAANAGTSVKAAAAGKVIYSGNGIRGYGNLIIIEHTNDFFTVYGYNKKNLVKSSDFVGQGDKIALSGTPQNGGSPRLHFEIRQGKTAVNPIFYLP